MFKFINNNSGFALPLVFMVMALVITLGAAMLMLTDTEVKIAANDYYATKALYLADAGINYGIKLIADNELDKVPYKFELAAGEEVNVKSIAAVGPYSWKVTAQGKYKKIIKEVSAEIEYTPSRYFQVSNWKIEK